MTDAEELADGAIIQEVKAALAEYDEATKDNIHRGGTESSLGLRNKAGIAARIIEARHGVGRPWDRLAVGESSRGR